MAVMNDAFPTIIAFAGIVGAKFLEKTVTPPGMDGGGPIDITTMRNSTLRTRSPKKLKSLDEMAVTVAYDPGVYTQVWAQLNVNQAITVTFPDATTVVFYGYINTFRPNEHREGDQPTAAMSIVPTNLNGSGVETPPAYSPAPPPPP